MTKPPEGDIQTSQIDGTAAKKHIVEFLAMTPKEVSEGDKPHQVSCKCEEEAVALEQKFHAVG